MNVNTFNVNLFAVVCVTDEWLRSLRLHLTDS